MSTDDSRIYKIKEVAELTRLSRSNIYRLVALGRFPKPSKLAESRSSGWLSSEIHSWIKQQFAKPLAQD